MRMIEKVQFLCFALVALTHFPITGLDATTPTANTSRQKCNVRAADVAFILDSSGSVGNTAWTQSLEFTKRIIEGYDIGRDRVRIAFIVFGTRSQIVFDFNKYTTKEQVLNAVTNAPRFKTSTNTHLALNSAANGLFKQAAGMRSGVPSILYVITDGRSANPRATRRSAQMIHSKGINVFAVGIRGAKRSELDAIASKPQYVFTFSSFNKLSELQNEFNNKTCQATKKIEEKENKSCMETTTTNVSVVTSKGSTITGIGNLRCVFPFTYRDALHHQCITEGNNGTLWCSTTPDYDRDRKRIACQEIYTCVKMNHQGKLFCAPQDQFKTFIQKKRCPGGANQVANGTCVFPFRYQNELYHRCTTAGDHGVLWCATTYDFDEDKKWKECEEDEKEQCVFPFIYRKTKYHSCITNDNRGKLWCSTTSNYDVDHKSKPCTEEPHPELKCVFPFTYKHTTYNSCTKIDRGFLWCSTTSNYDTDKQWTACEQTIENYGRCAFPFTYCHARYDTCTRKNNNGTLWCATTHNYDRDKKWTYCEEPVCKFPFTYKNKQFNSCTKTGNGRVSWCATTANYDKDQECILCEKLKPVPGKRCIFPFTYKNSTFNQCTDLDFCGVRWCATTPNYETDRQFTVCE